MDEQRRIDLHAFVADGEPVEEEEEAFLDIWHLVFLQPIHTRPHDNPAEGSG